MVTLSTQDEEDTDYLRNTIEEDGLLLLECTLNMFDINMSKDVFCKIIENIHISLNNLQQLNKYYEFLFLYTGLNDIYGDTNYIFFNLLMKIIEKINVIDIIYFCIKHDFHKSIFDVLSSNYYIDLCLFEMKNNIYESLFELLNILIDNIDIIKNDDISLDSQTLYNKFVTYELKYINKDQLNLITLYICQNKDNYLNILNTLHIFCLDITDNIYKNISSHNNDKYYSAYDTNQFIFIKKFIWDKIKTCEQEKNKILLHNEKFMNIFHEQCNHKKKNSFSQNFENINTNNSYQYWNKKEYIQYDNLSDNSTITCSDKKQISEITLTSQVKNVDNFLFLYKYEEIIVLMKRKKVKSIEENMMHNKNDNMEDNNKNNNMYSNMNDNMYSNMNNNMYSNMNDNMYSNMNDNMYNNINDNMYNNINDNMHINNNDNIYSNTNSEITKKSVAKNSQEICAYKIKFLYMNINLLKTVVCIFLKSEKVTQYMDEHVSKKLIYFFNDTLNDIMEYFYKEKKNQNKKKDEIDDVYIFFFLFVDIFYNDILKTYNKLILYYNKNVEKAPKETMLFYKTFNKIIDHICIYIYNNKMFKEICNEHISRINEEKCEKKKNKSFMFYTEQKGQSFFNYFENVTYYLLFYLFYIILEETNKMNNEIFLFFVCQLINNQEEKEEKEEVKEGEKELYENLVKNENNENNENLVNNQNNENTLGCLKNNTNKFILEKVEVDPIFLFTYKEEIKNKSINRVITIYIFLQKKINKFFSFFKYIFSYIYDDVVKMKHEKKKNRNRNQFLNTFIIILKNIKYIIIDMFIKYMDMLLIYKYYFKKGHNKDEKNVPYYDEFLLYMKSVQNILFTILPFSSNDIITKLSTSYTNKCKLVKYNMSRNHFVSFNISLYGLGNKKKNDSDKYYLNSGCTNNYEDVFFDIGYDLKNNSDNKKNKTVNNMYDIYNGNNLNKMNRLNYIDSMNHVNIDSNGILQHTKDMNTPNIFCFQENIEDINIKLGTYEHFLNEEYNKSLNNNISCDKNDDEKNNKIYFEKHIILLNVMSIILLNIMEECVNNKYKYVFFTNSYVHIIMMRILNIIHSSNYNYMNIFDYHVYDIDNVININEKKNILDIFFQFPYEILCRIIIIQLKFFSNKTLNNYNIFTVLVEYIFYISSEVNPFFFYKSRYMWDILSFYINKENDMDSLSSLINIIFYLISQKGIRTNHYNNNYENGNIICSTSNVDDSNIFKNEHDNKYFDSKIKSNNKQYLLYSFLRKQFFLNKSGKNYIYFLGLFLKNITSSDLIQTVMKIFIYKYHMNLQYTLNILLLYLNAFEKKVEKHENNGLKKNKNGKEDDVSVYIDVENNIKRNVEIKQFDNYNIMGHQAFYESELNTNDDNDDIKNVNSNLLLQNGKNQNNNNINDINYKNNIDENKIISLYIYFDIINIFPPNFFECINEINLIKDIQNIFNLLIYLHEEYILLEKRNMKYKYSKIFKKIKKQNIKDYPLYYYNSAKMYYPLIISSLISHSFFFIMNQYSNFILPNFHIINFYQKFFSNKYLYTLCDNNVYLKILNESFIICMNILKIKNDQQEEQQGNYINMKVDKENLTNEDKIYEYRDISDDDKTLISHNNNNNDNNYNFDKTSESVKPKCEEKKERNILYNDINRIDINIISCLFKVYIIFLKDYSSFFLSSIMILLKNNIILLNDIYFMDIYKTIYNYLQKDEKKYTNLFKYLISSIFQYFFFSKNNDNNMLQDKYEDSTNIILRHMKENITIIYHRNLFLNVFFQNILSSSYILSSPFCFKKQILNFLQTILNKQKSSDHFKGLSNFFLLNNW
ncbi:conserved Plasmodium protein, unknown function [Plasmodium sp. DRC-Itaito]|nr:conserved Plasmodium protein, unknown function [Plasmodium sp. DRC-Itaito]